MARRIRIRRDDLHLWVLGLTAILGSALAALRRPGATVVHHGGRPRPDREAAMQAAASIARPAIERLELRDEAIPGYSWREQYPGLADRVAHWN